MPTKSTRIRWTNLYVSSHTRSRTDADEITTIVAPLHAEVEDTKYTLEDLRERSFSEKVVEAVSLLTKQKGLPEQEYYDRIKHNCEAKIC